MVQNIRVALIRCLMVVYILVGTYGASSKLFHLNELSKTAKEKAMAYGMKKKPAPKKKKKKAAPKKVKPMKRGLLMPGKKLT